MKHHNILRLNRLHETNTIHFSNYSFIFFAQAQDSINNIVKIEAKDTVAKTAKKLWLYFTPFTLGTKLNSNTTLLGTHLSINILLKSTF